MRDFKNLTVWQKSHQLTLKVYRATVDFPREELYGLTSQMRRAASSIPANIAEGCGRNSDADMARFIQIAAGSGNELEYHLLLAHDLGLLSDTAYQPLDRDVNEIKRMLVALSKSLKARG